MKVLVINCGSTTLKYQVIDSSNEEMLCKGLCDRIGIDGGNFTYQKTGGDKEQKDVQMPSHKEAIEEVLTAIANPKTGVISGLDEIGAVGHRVVHGGEKFTAPTLITDDVIKVIDECTPFAPLHNPANIIGINACRELMPDTPMVAVFDTAFNQTIPQKAYMYGIPYEYYEKYGVRKYGFHGTSHSYVSKRAAEIVGKPYDKLKTIVCHLGGGSSLCAVKFGKSFDTTMGFSPLEGLIMGTRSGDIDPTAVNYIAEREHISVDDVLTILNKKSGVLGVSGLSSDFRDLAEAAMVQNERAALALDMFSYRVAKYIGAYAMAMKGVDVIAFTAGIGENNGYVRAEIMNYISFLGIELDEEANKLRGKEVKISTPTSKVKVYVIPTNEELEICRQTVALLQ